MLDTNRITEFLPELSNATAADRRCGRTLDGHRNTSGGEKYEAPPDQLAKLIAPPADARLNDKRFAAIRQQLIQHYQPITPVQLVDIDLIASDLLHLASVRQAMELITAPAVPAETIKAARGARQTKRLIKLLKRLIGRGEASHPFDCSEREAEMTAPVLMQEFQRVQEWVAEADVEAAERAAADPNTMEKIEDYGPDSEDPRYRQLLDTLLPIAPALQDAQRTKRVLSGGQTLSPMEHIRWTAILKLAKESASLGNYGSDQAVAAFTAAQRAMLVQLAQDPIRLAVLHRTANQFEEAIEKRVRRLKNSR